MKRMLFIIITLFITNGIIASQKYNPFNDRWETVPNNWSIKYNAFEDSWSHQPQGASIEYNAFEDTWDWNSGHN